MNKTVLIVEDDDDTRFLYGAILMARGYHVLSATEGAEGILIACKHIPDLILMDVHMPVMDGIHAVGYLKSDPRTSHIPVFAVSAIDPGEIGHLRHGWRAFDRTFRKPLTPSEIATAVEARIGKPTTTNRDS